MNYKQLQLKEYLSILGITLRTIAYRSNLPTPVTSPQPLLLLLFLLSRQRPIMFLLTHLNTAGKRGKIQSKITNYAKQTQFTGYSNERNLFNNSGL